MTTPLPPLPGHPEPHTYRWTDLELRAIEQYGAECARLALAAREHAAPARLLELADRIDHERLCRRAGLDRSGWTQEQKDRCDAGVHLRRYADLLGSDCWRIFPPRPGISFRASRLDDVVAMAQRDEAGRAALDPTPTTSTQR